MRPTQTINLSKVSEVSLPELSLYVTTTSLPLTFVPVTLEPRRISMPCFVNIFFVSLAICWSIIERKSSIASINTTLLPILFQTLPNSNPITPAPMTPNLFGVSIISKAPLESTIVSPLTFATGISIGLDPVAIIMLSAVRIWVFPS